MNCFKRISKRAILSFALCLGVAVSARCSAFAQNKPTVNAESHTRYVDPFIGTTKSAVLTRWGGSGGTYPGAVAPSGSIQLSPETRITGAKGYDYTDQQIYFFSCIKHYSGFPEGSSGHVFIMPVSKGQQFDTGITRREFRHQDEQAQPGYYKVVFTDDHTVAEASASMRTGMFRFAFPARVTPQLFVGDAGEISFTGKRTLHGTLANTVINFSEDLLDKKQVKGGYLLSFKPLRDAKAKTAVITLKLSTSTVDYAAAQKNIDTEIGAAGFDQLRERTARDWEKQLSTVDVSGGGQQNKIVFYTALYHSLLIPWVISDSDGRYRGADGKIYKTGGNNEYGGFSPWDTFRSLHPLLSLLYPGKQKDAILSMLDVYRQTGHLPTESMTGNHAVPVIVDAYLKGINGFDINLAYTAMKKNLVEAPFVQNDMEIYHQLGYVPSSNAESVTRTVEYAYNDWALGEYAKQVMNDDQLYKLEQQRGLNYRNLFHPQSLFMLPRKDNHFRLEPGMTGYKEGNKWVYSWFVPHNGKDLVNLMGGNAAFAARLDSAMRNDVILYDNETVLHVPYLFNTPGYPSLTQKWVRNILLERFKAAPGGLPGNDDLGSMSSAYLFNAMGIFPVSPGRPLYAIGAPLFQTVKLHLANQKTFTIEAKGQSNLNKYVQSLKVNHQPYEQLVLNHGQIMQGGTMEFVMSNSPDQRWPKDRDPLALSETKTSADIRLLQYEISKTVVAPHELFRIHFSLQNKGSLGTEKVVVKVNGRPILFKYVLVPPGTTVRDSVSCRLYSLGKVTISLSTDADDKTLLPAEEAATPSSEPGRSISVVESSKPVNVPYLLSELNYNPVVHQDSSQYISYAAQNITGRRQKLYIPVRVGDQVVFTDTITLEPGQKIQTVHSFTMKGQNRLPGMKVLSLGNQVEAGGLSAVFKIYNDHLSSLLLDLSLLTHGSNMLSDHSGFGNNAVINEKFGAANVVGKPVLLDENRFVEVPNAVSLDHMAESLTMMCWVYPENGNKKGLTDMFSKGDHHVLQTSNDQTLTFFAGGWGRGDITVDLPANWKQQWHHLAGVCRGDMLWLYIDGKLCGTARVEGSVNMSVDSKWQIGRNEEFPSERVFHGYVDQVKVYSQPLSPDEIAAIVAAEKDILITIN
ncbi:alpha-1,2-mannosidase, putative [Pedobacter westerhofensis]|uniref:Alpha-1,2-mannosidase, putative n=1 Tax=Pedobacter westerhofensis TaxID=425512 RepID=A0A521CTA7_9SPHI|nr:GH92 family glycosyl hydrolase [Pedobacter westerhofensis]SMO61870.1 alpha-1,2-mannosidase, putative [Pedobacter westerhofensis]